jgi:hypothetical protein
MRELMPLSTRKTHHPIIHRRLGELFDLLKITPTAHQIDEFEADLRKLNQLLLKETLQALSETKWLSLRLPRNYRGLVLTGYHRRVKRITDLARYFFVFESALRATTAAEIELYHNSVQWWEPVEAALAAGKCRSPVKGFTQDQVKVVATALCNIYGHNVQRSVLENNTSKTSFADGSQLLSKIDLGMLRSFVLAYWGPCFRKYYIPKGGRLGLSKTDFHDRCTLVIGARNSAYHHNPVRGSREALSAVRNLLSYLGVNADQEVAALTAVS